MASQLTRREMLKRSLLGVAGLTVVSCAGNATGSPSQVSSPSASNLSDLVGDLVAKAKQEQTLTYYNLGGDVNNRLVAGFEAKYGIHVERQTLGIVPMSQTFTAEQQAGKGVADLINNTDYVFFDSAAKNGWIIQPDIPSAKGWPPEYWHDGTVTFAIGQLNISYNTQLVPTTAVPKQWKDLLDPRWRGKILMVDPRPTPTYQRLFALLRKDNGDAFLSGLATQGLQLTSSGIPGSAKVAAGDVALMFPNAHWNLTQLIQQGAPVASTYPTPTSGSEQLMAIARGAPHPNAALLFLNYAMSPEGQAAACSRLCTSRLPNVPDSVTLPTDYVPFRSLPTPTSGEQAEMWKLLGLA